MTRGTPIRAQTAERGTPIRVVARRLGYYGILREPGSVFVVKSEGELGSWMERVDEKPQAQAAEKPGHPAA